MEVFNGSMILCVFKYVKLFHGALKDIFST